jgi:hypothetical protein
MQNINLAQFTTHARQTQADAYSKESVKATDSVQRQTNGAADFVAKIKGTNEAMGFIATALKGLDALSSSSNPAETVKNYNFNGSNILDAKTFDTTAGVVGVSVYLGDLNASDPAFNDRIEKSKTELLDLKSKISSPVTVMKTKQEDSLRAQANSTNPIISKLNNILDGIEAGANRVGNQIF